MVKVFTTSNFSINIQCWVSLMRCSVSIGQYSPPRKSHVMTIIFSNPITIYVYRKSPFRLPGRFQKPYISPLHANPSILSSLLYLRAKASSPPLPFSKANNCSLHLILCLLQKFFTHITYSSLGIVQMKSEKGILILLDR